MRIGLALFPGFCQLDMTGPPALLAAIRTSGAPLYEARGQACRRAAARLASN